MAKTAELKQARSPATDHLIVVAMTAIMFMAIGLRLYHLGGPSLWYDEFLSVSIASGSVDTISPAVKQAEQTPPLFHYFMHFWIKAYGLSEFAIRLPAAICGIGAVWMIYKLGSVLYSRREGCIAALLMAVSPFQISYSQEARVYAPLMFVGLLSCYAFVKLVQTGGRKNQVAYVLATGLLYWIHLHSVFIVAVQQITWIYLCMRSRKSGEALKVPPGVWIACSVIALALFAPWMPTVYYWVTQAAQAFWIAPMTASFLPATYALYAGSAVMLVLLLALDVCGVVRTSERWKMTFLIALLVVPVLIPYVVSLTIRPLFIPRYGIITAAGLFLLAARGCTALPSKAVQAIVLLILVSVSVVNAYPELRDGPPNKPDVRGATEFVIHAAHHGDAILLNSYANSIFVHYLRDVDTTNYRMTYETKDIPAARSVEPGTVLWVMSLRGVDGNFPMEFKKVAMERGWQQADTRDFHGVRLDRFTRK
jgi:uncharacterized membrane protein